MLACRVSKRKEFFSKDRRSFKKSRCWRAESQKARSQSAICHDRYLFLFFRNTIRKIIQTRYQEIPLSKWRLRSPKYAGSRRMHSSVTIYKTYSQPTGTRWRTYNGSCFDFIYVLCQWPCQWPVSDGGPTQMPCRDGTGQLSVTCQWPVSDGVLPTQMPCRGKVQDNRNHNISGIISRYNF